MEFYLIEQNNSGGYYQIYDKLCRKLIIQAEDNKLALEKAEALGCYWGGAKKGIDCSCCGDRWESRTNLIELGDLYNSIEEYAQSVSNEAIRIKDKNKDKPVTRIFYANGEVKEFFKLVDR